MTRYSATSTATTPFTDLGFDGFERLPGLVAPRLRDRTVVEVFPEFSLLLQIDNHSPSFTAAVY